MTQQSIFGETEKKAAERYRWWHVYLVREKRRLAGITEAVRAATAAAAAPQTEPPAVLPGESAEEYMNRVEKLKESASQVTDVVSE
jgi:hypothetical protein